MLHLVIEFVGLFFSGMLAGEEFVIRYGVRGPLAALDDRSHIRIRQGLIRTLRVLVPAIFLPSLVIGIVVAILDGSAAGIVWRWLGVAALLIWLLVTIFGTVPINEAALDWDPAAPPSGWGALVDRWERLNTVRTWAALVAFGSFLIAVALRGHH